MINNNEDVHIILNAYSVGALGLAIIISCIICFILGVFVGWLITK